MVRMAKAIACLGIYLTLGRLLPPATLQGSWYRSAGIPLRCVNQVTGFFQLRLHAVRSLRVCIG